MTNFDDDMADIFGAPLTPAQRVAGERTAAAFTPSGYIEACPACRGRGRFISWAGRDCGPCFKCKGEGKLTFKQSPEQRANGRANASAARERKAESLKDAARAWAQANPDDAAWIASKSASFEFARAMADALAAYGTLTERQHATVTRLRIADTERAALRASVAASAPTVEIAAIEKTFSAAQANSIKRPILRLDTFKLSLAPASGTNAGAIYVKQDDEYLGKIKDGRFIRVRACDDATEARVIAVCADPKAAAIAYGRREGSCSCCGRTLTNHTSIDLGIGPICAEKFGW
jgi:hypothetical protein